MVELWIGFAVTIVLTFWLGVSVGIDYEFKRISADPAIRFALGRHKEED